MPVPSSRKGEKSQEYISRLISFFRHEGMPQKQAIAAAYNSAREKGFRIPLKKAVKRRLKGRK